MIFIEKKHDREIDWECQEGDLRRETKFLGNKELDNKFIRSPQIRNRRVLPPYVLVGILPALKQLRRRNNKWSRAMNPKYFNDKKHSIYSDK